MHTLAWIITIIVDLAAVYLLARVVRFYLRVRGQRLVTCPETNRTATVELDATRVAIDELRHKAGLHLDYCSRWPERRKCGQECLQQIEAAPEGCLVRNIVADWFRGKHCVQCGKHLGSLDGWGQHQPALRDQAGKTFLWNELRAETLPEQFSTSQPLCWDCHISEAFRRQHPELAVDRAPTEHRVGWLR